MPTLTIAGVPIDDNWRELDPRLISAVKSAELLIAEERKNALRLLVACDCKDKPFILINEHSTAKDRDHALEIILKTANTVFVSDAGTPCVADPDYKLVDMCILSGVEIRSVPGASSIIAALSVSGFVTERFMFMGFPPRDKGMRKSFFNEIANSRITTAFLERPYALAQTLSDMKGITKQISLCIGLGTENECNIRGSISTIAAKADGIKNTFVVVVDNSEKL